MTRSPRENDGAHVSMVRCGTGYIKDKSPLLISISQESGKIKPTSDFR